ncbi:hypothetical protein RIE95_09825 [Acidithiobacillus thiooxidans]|jgi:antitoxin StbD|uniref:Antitoxin of toxin-antitoxin stability system n=1 Tax=Acidithiobacillus thiooxidans ATCC 19377 TaxID=637390 RepID=A0A543Q3B2_ACITH|nr:MULTISPECIES: hypothetical protein [Acidithiobacillus]MDR7927277.1 hypothetical protein [Acidithiobacillus thiooxidans]MDX5935054.1 hypothetical protein [Acidithiobacillus thiooxidans]TQN50819.1 hypothetical protein DLNHIDIE_00675 [Acidithiobacillus thiooxidans ATCC 19377]
MSILQKVMCGYTTPVSKFKNNPNAALLEAQGDAIAVSSNNRVQFYVVPAELFEEMTAFCEFAQRGRAALQSIPAHFTAEGVDMDKITTGMAVKIKNGQPDDYDECL